MKDRQRGRPALRTGTSAAPMSTETRSGGRVEVEEAVSFARAGGVDLLCDVYHPPEPNGTGVLLLFGGGWQAGTRKQLRGYGILLGRIGYTCVCSEYRLAPPRSPDRVETDPRLAVGARWPAQLHDVKAAIRWIRANAGALHVNEDRIVAAGFSAGGHLALIAGGTPDVPELEGDGGNAGVSSRIAAVAAYYPPTDLTAPLRGEYLGWPGNTEALLGDDPDPDALRAASPVAYAGPEFPPTLLFHGTADRAPGDRSDRSTVAHRSSVLMYEALEAAGAPVEVHLWAGLPHMFDLDPPIARLCVQIIDAFLARHLPAGRDATG